MLYTSRMLSNTAQTYRLSLWLPVAKIRGLPEGLVTDRGSAVGNEKVFGGRQRHKFPNQGHRSLLRDRPLVPQSAYNPSLATGYCTIWPYPLLRR